MPLSLGVAPIHDLLPPASDITLVPLKSIFSHSKQLESSMIH